MRKVLKACLCLLQKSYLAHSSSSCKPSSKPVPLVGYPHRQPPKTQCARWSSPHTAGFLPSPAVLVFPPPGLTHVPTSSTGRVQPFSHYMPRQCLETPDEEKLRLLFCGLIRCFGRTEEVVFCTPILPRKSESCFSSRVRTPLCLRSAAEKNKSVFLKRERGRVRLHQEHCIRVPAGQHPPQFLSTARTQGIRKQRWTALLLCFLKPVFRQVLSRKGPVLQTDRTS